MEEIAGKGNRRPLLDINIDLISLDRSNPRLIPYLNKEETVTQDDLTRILFDHFDSENVGLSLVQNGYFDEEPIVVIPNNVPEGFDPYSYKDVDSLTEAYKKLIANGKINFIVVEGNRRSSAIKLIIDQNLRKRINLDGIFPTTSNEGVIYDITNIPAIIYPKREDVFTYLGIRHIAGNLKWEAFAQASYAADMIDHYVEGDKDVSEAIEKVQKIIAHRSDKLVKQYVTFKLYSQAKEDLEFDVKPIVNKFSLLTVAYNSGSIREYLKLPTYNNVDFSKELITHDKLENFRNVLTWIYGDEKRNKKRVLSDSRKITSELSHVVKHKEAVEYLLKHEDLEGAYDRTNGEEIYLINKIQGAIKGIKTSLQFAYKYKQNKDILDSVEELKGVTEALENMLK